MLLNSGVSAIGTGGNRAGEYCIESTACRSIKSPLTESKVELLKSLILIFCSFDKVANLARRQSLEIPLKSLTFTICLYYRYCCFFPDFKLIKIKYDVKYDVAIVILMIFFRLESYFIVYL